MSEDIVRMARQADLPGYPDELKAFAELVRAAERKACVLDIQLCIPRIKPDTEEMIRMKKAISLIEARSEK